MNMGKSKLATPGYRFILILSGEMTTRKITFDRHGDARRSAHKHLLESSKNEAAIITLFTPKVMGRDERGMLAIKAGETVVHGVFKVSRVDAEIEARHSISLHS